MAVTSGSSPLSTLEDWTACATAWAAAGVLAAEVPSSESTCSIMALRSFSFIDSSLLYFVMNTEASPARPVSLPFSEKPIFSSHWSNSLMGRRPKISRSAAASWKPVH